MDSQTAVAGMRPSRRIISMNPFIPFTVVLKLDLLQYPLGVFLDRCNAFSLVNIYSNVARI